MKAHGFFQTVGKQGFQNINGTIQHRGKILHLHRGKRIQDVVDDIATNRTSNSDSQAKKISNPKIGNN